MPDHTPLDSPYARAIERLQGLLEEAGRAGAAEPTAAALATTGKQARPSVRIVEVARVSAGGICIFAHRRSGKGQQMLDNPRAALCFHWPSLRQQVTVEGDVAMLPDVEADALWNHRPREMTLGHWASDQVAAPALDHPPKERVAELKRQFDFERVPRPPDWCAYEIHPDRIEFWETGWDRLKSRIRVQRGDDGIWRDSAVNP